MDALTIIVNDARRRIGISRGMGYTAAAAFVFVVAALGLGLRDDYSGVFAPETLLSNILLAGMVGLFPAFYLQKKMITNSARKTLPFIGGLVLLLSLRKVFFNDQATTYMGWMDFWHENLKCLIKGGLTSAFLSGCATLVVFRMTSLPSWSARTAAVLFATLGGLVMLVFHCDSTSLAHTLISHWGQALVVGFLAYQVQRHLILRKAGEILAGREKNLRPFTIP